MDINNANNHPLLTKILVIFFYSLAWILIVINSFFFFKVITKIRKEINHEEDLVLVEKFTSKLKWYPIVQIICLIPGTINRIYNMCTDQNNFELTLLQAIFDYLSGFLFAIVYGFNSSIKKAIYKCLFMLCCCFKEEKTTKIIRQRDIDELDQTNKESFGNQSCTFRDQTLRSSSEAYISDTNNK